MKTFKLLFAIWATLIFAGIMLIFLPFILIPPLFGHRGTGFTFYFLKVWCWLFSKISFINYRIAGTEKLIKNQPYIYVSNHTSFLDLPGLCLAIPGQFRPLAKKELLSIPVFGWVVNAVTVVVDRSSPESRNQSLLNLIRILKLGIPALIFPEGTQNRTDQILQPFKDGAFRMALETQAPIVPIAINGAAELLPPGTFSARPGIIHIQIGEPVLPVSYQGMSVQDLKALTFERMKEMLLDMQQTNSTGYAFF